jgi:hypothetical protein
MPNSIPNVFWYGERGIINAVVSHVNTSGDFVGSIRNLLKATCWGTGSRPSWIEEISDAHLIVEVGLADFGDPDLLIICRTGSKKTYLVFLEAKAQSYTDSMQKTSALRAGKWGMEQDGFNSSINGQLTLKYRFANALSLWDGRAAAISESRPLFEAYKVRLNDSPKKSPGRSLAKPSILTGIFGRLGLAGLPEANCHYIALTWDCESKAFFNSPDVPFDYLPVFLGEDGEGTFSTMLDRVGWIGYKQLEGAIGLSNATEYKAAFTTMLDSPEPPLSFYSEKRQGRWESFPGQIIELGEGLALALGTVPLPSAGSRAGWRSLWIDQSSRERDRIKRNRHELRLSVRESVLRPERQPFLYCGLDGDGFLSDGLPRKQRLQIVLKLGGVPKGFCLCSGLESPLVLPLPEPLPIESGLGPRPVELAPPGTATPGGVTICFIWTIRRVSAEDFDFHLVLLFGL